MPLLTSARQYIVDQFLALGHELRFWHTSTARMLFSLQVIVALALAVWISETSGLHFGWWAALSSFAVTRTTPKESARRAIQRMLGTILGGGVGILAAIGVIQHVDISLLLCSLIGGYTVYRANESPWSYAWVLGAVTAMMVSMDAQTVSSFATVLRFTLSRVAEVAIGVSMCVMTGLIFRWAGGVFQRVEEKPRVGTPQEAVISERLWRTKRVWLGVQSGIAIFIVSLVLLQANISDLSQAIITILALLILPSGKNVPETNQQIIDRMVQRLVGCLLAGSIGVLLLPLLQDSPLLYILALIVGLWLGCHLQQGSDRVSYTGRQFTVAWIMMFIQPHYWFADPHAAVLRFYGIMLGVLILAAIMLIGAFVKWR